MVRLLANYKNRRRGIVAVLIALVLIGLLGVTAIAIDGGLMQDNRRRVQAAADAAAMAAAAQMFAEYRAIVLSNYTNFDPGNQAATVAYNSANTNGYNNDGVTSTVTVNIPPKSGPFLGQIGYIEVLITYYQPRYFSTIWGSGTLPISVRAVSRGAWVGSNDGILVLDPNAKGSLTSTGGGSVVVTGGANVIVDSSNTSAAIDSGGGASTANQFLVTGGYSGVFNGPVQTGVPPTPDPLRNLPVPTMPSAGVMTKKKDPVTGGTVYTLSPGLYTNLPNFTNGDTVYFQQASAGNGGIYWIQGGFTANSANLLMDPTSSGGLMFYNDPTNSSNSQGFSIAGNASSTIILSALSDGPYAGILFWQRRDAATSINITGNGNFNLTGTFYAANANMQVSGNGNAIIGSQYIARTVSFSGNGATLINYTDKGTARMRIIQLVE